MKPRRSSTHQAQPRLHSRQPQSSSSSSRWRSSSSKTRQRSSGDFRSRRSRRRPPPRPLWLPLRSLPAAPSSRGHPQAKATPPRACLPWGPTRSRTATATGPLRPHPPSRPLAQLPSASATQPALLVLLPQRSQRTTAATATEAAPSVPPSTPLRLGPSPSSRSWTSLTSASSTASVAARASAAPLGSRAAQTRQRRSRAPTSSFAPRCLSSRRPSSELRCLGMRSRSARGRFLRLRRSSRPRTRPCLQRCRSEALLESPCSSSSSSSSSPFQCHRFEVGKFGSDLFGCWCFPCCAASVQAASGEELEGLKRSVGALKGACRARSVARWKQWRAEREAEVGRALAENLAILRRDLEASVGNRRVMRELLSATRSLATEQGAGRTAGKFGLSPACRVSAPSEIVTSSPAGSALT